MNKENWKEVKGYEEAYLVSDLGRVKSLPRKVAFGEQERITDEIILSGSDNGNGYLYVTLTYKGVRTRAYIHRLVAEHFINRNNEQTEVNHINGNKIDNRKINLEWVTPEENREHAIINGLHGGTASYLSLITLNMIVDLLKSGKYTIGDIARVFDVSAGVIRKVRETDEELSKELQENIDKRKNRGNSIQVIDKNTGETKEFKSAKEAADTYGYYEGYFSEVVTKYGGENANFKASYIERN